MSRKKKETLEDFIFQNLLFIVATTFFVFYLIMWLFTDLV